MPAIHGRALLCLISNGSDSPTASITRRVSTSETTYIRTRSEGFPLLLKRGVNGTFHHVGRAALSDATWTNLRSQHRKLADHECPASSWRAPMVSG